MAVTTAKTLPEQIMEARRTARQHRARGDQTRAAMWDDRVDQLLDHLPRPRKY